MRCSCTLAWMFVLGTVGCAGSPATEAATDGTTEAPGVRRDVAPVAVVSPPGTLPGGSGSASSGTYDANGESWSVFGVAGSVVAWVDNGETWSWMYPGGVLQCGGTVEGVTHSVSIVIGDQTEPGTYPNIAGTSYQREWCEGSDSENCTTQTFTAEGRLPNCSVVITTAPAEVWSGKFGGTFSCTALADADGGTIDLYEGSFLAPAGPPPD
jgi:hypothetical protein